MFPPFSTYQLKIGQLLFSIFSSYPISCVRVCVCVIIYKKTLHLEWNIRMVIWTSTIWQWWVLHLFGQLVIRERYKILDETHFFLVGLKRIHNVSCTWKKQSMQETIKKYHIIWSDCFIWPCRDKNDYGPHEKSTLSLRQKLDEKK